MMKVYYTNARLPETAGFGSESVTVVTDGAFISAIGKGIPVPVGADVIDCGGDLLMPGFYNTHCHAAMTLLRGYGEDLPLQAWLTDKIFPAEDRLTAARVKMGTALACAEMIRNGVVSFSDMYMFEDAVASAVFEAGLKANLSRDLVSFDPNQSIHGDRRFEEAVALEKEWQNAGEGRIKIIGSLHAVYTNQEKYIREFAAFARENGWRLQIHVSETVREKEDCIAAHGKTPVAYLADLGVFDVPVTAAHCVTVTKEDAAILAEKQVTVAHNPVSNLKLGSGVMPYGMLRRAGVRIALGTDGTASNNRLDMLREMQYAALIHKGVNCDSTATHAADMVTLATRNGAVAQGRDDCGEIAVGKRADMILVDLHTPHNLPVLDTASTLCYSAEASDVRMTVVDGKILYRDGEYTTLDVEKLTAEFSDTVAHYFD